MNMKGSRVSFVICTVVAVVALALGGCDRLPFGSRLNRPNYNKITPGMSKAQVELILGKPARVETRDLIILKKTTYRYEHGKDFAIITFKNDEMESKDTNMGTNP
jgi:hypothetical protein